MVRVGILGGTFDPIHIGHLVIAEEARVKINLEKIIFMPAGRPWMKGNQVITKPGNRWDMTVLAISNNKWFEASPRELSESEPTYTVDTLKQIRSEDKNSEMFFILGQDALGTFVNWKDPCGILELCTIVVASRPRSQEQSITALEQRCPDASQNMVILNSPLVSFSGTEIRRRVSQGRSIRYMVPSEVEGYIYRNHLYSGDKEA